MIWILLLAHFLGDFLLQTDWIARRKNNIWVLLLHIGIHMAVMVILTWQVGTVVWPYLLLLALLHFVQDSLKLRLTTFKQRTRVLFFLLDQAVHYLIIWGIVEWFQSRHNITTVPDNPRWAILALVYLLVTNVWFISERIFNLQNSAYLKNINDTKIPRMVTRAVMLSLFLALRGWVLPGTILLLSVPYSDEKFRKRALLTDLIVSLSGFLFIVIAPA